MQWSQVSQSLDYHTPVECRGSYNIFCIFLFSLLLLLPLLTYVFHQGPHFRTMLLSLRFSPLLLVVDLDEWSGTVTNRTHGTD